MKDNGFISLEGTNYLYYLNENNIMLFPIDEENIYPLSRFTEEAYTLELMGSRGVRGAIWKHTAFIKQTNYSFNDIIELKAKCVFSRWESIPIGGFDLFGEAIDDLFYYGQDDVFINIDSIYDLGEKVHVIGSWTVTYKKREVHISLQYGNVLSNQGRNILEFHPVIRVTVAGEEDMDLLYEIYECILNFVRLIRYRSTCGKIEVKLISADENRQRIGRVCINPESSPFSRRYPIASFSFWKPYIQTLLNFVISDPELDLNFFPSNSLRNSPEDYNPTTFSRIYTAFENECHKNKPLYEQVDCSAVNTVRNGIIERIKSFEAEIKSDITAEEQKFIQKAINRVKQLDTEMGQKGKILHAFEIIRPIIEGYISFFVDGYESCHEISKNTAIGLLGSIPTMRGKILHDGDRNLLTREETYAMQLLEMVVYAQILKRAQLKDKEISKIIRFNFELEGGNYTFLTPD